MPAVVPKISNPLTIVGLFATVTEAGGLYVLPNLSPENQSMYVIFLMGFPVLLIVLFFITLWCSPQVLFTPEEHGGADSYRAAVTDRKNRDAYFAAFIKEPNFFLRNKKDEPLVSYDEVFNDAKR